MPRYFFNARLGDELVVDAKGVEMDNLESVREQLATALRESNLDLNQAWQFEITDAEGRIHQVVPISDLVGRRPH